MAEISQSMIGMVLSFQLYPSAILTDDFTDVKLIGLVNHEAASVYMSPAQKHATVYPTLPIGTPNDYRLYEYAIIRKQDGKMTAVGVPWIKADTVTVSQTVELLITVRNKSIDDIPRLRQILTQNRFTDIDVDVKSHL